MAWKYTPGTSWQAWSVFGAHAALADHALEVEVAHHIALVGLLADAGGRPGGHEVVLLRVQPGHHRPAVIDQPAVQQRLERLRRLPGRRPRAGGFS